MQTITEVNLKSTASKPKKGANRQRAFSYCVRCNTCKQERYDLLTQRQALNLRDFHQFDTLRLSDATPHLHDVTIWAVAPEKFGSRKGWAEVKVSR